MEAAMQEQSLPECTPAIEPQVIDLGEPSADGADLADLPELIVPCIPVPED